MTPTNGSTNGYHVPTPEPEPTPERRQPTTALALILATLMGGTVTGVTSYGVYHRARPPCAAPAATLAKDDCTCPTCPPGQACYKTNCTCVAVAVAIEMERKDEQRRMQRMLRLLMEQRLADSCGGNLTEVELR